MASSSLPEKPTESSVSRQILQWSLLGGAIVGYVIVYLSVVYTSPVGFIAGLGVCLLVAVITLVMQFVGKGSQSVGENAPDYLTAQFDWPALFVQRVRRLKAAFKGHKK